MATVDFVYEYPYSIFSDYSRFAISISESRTYLNGSYTYPCVFKNTVPGCRHIKIGISVTNTGSGTALERNWDFMVCKSNGSWVDVETFYLDDTGEYTVDCDVNNLDVTKFAFVPSSNPGSSRTWEVVSTFYSITITEELELNEPTMGKFLYGVFPYRSGLKDEVHEVFANVGGVLVQATDVLANIDGTLVSVPPVYSFHHISESDSTLLVGFMPNTTGTYKIQNKRISGDHELRLYDSDFTPMKDGYFYDETFELTAGSLYYITITHYYREEETSESYLQIHKEE